MFIGRGHRAENDGQVKHPTTDIGAAVGALSEKKLASRVFDQGKY